MERPYILRRLAHDGYELLAHLGVRRFDFPGAHLDFAELRPVEFLRIFAQRVVAALADVCNYLPDRFRDLAVLFLPRRIAEQNFLKRSFGQLTYLYHTVSFQRCGFSAAADGAARSGFFGASILYHRFSFAARSASKETIFVISADLNL